MPTKKDLENQIDSMQSLLDLQAESIKDLKNEKDNAENKAINLQQRVADLETELASLRTTLIESPEPPEPIQNPKRGRPVSITPEQRRQIKALRERGASLRTICRETGLSLGAVHKIVRDTQ